MRINSNESIAGLPVLKVRDALRRNAWDLSADALAKTLNVEVAFATDLLTALKNHGWCEFNAKTGTWELTSAGLAFLNASAARPINRKRAEALLAAVIERTDRFHRTYVNWPVTANRIAVFGSYLGNSQTLSDLDIAIEFKKAEEHDPGWSSAREIAGKEGFKARSKFSRIFLPMDFLVSKLKQSNRSISIHDWCDLVELNCPYRTVWDRPQAERR